MPKILIKTEKPKASEKYPSTYLWIQGTDPINGNSFRYLCEVKSKSGITLISNYSVGIGHSPYSSIDATGSVKGMKRAGYWKEHDKTIRAFGHIFNINQIRFSHPLDALAYWLEQNNHADIADKNFSLHLQDDSTVSVEFL